MIRTQIQLPNALFEKLKRLAQLQETSLADVIRRASERELAAHPEMDATPAGWDVPKGRDLGLRLDVSVEEWRTLANADE